MSHPSSRFQNPNQTSSDYPYNTSSSNDGRLLYSEKTTKTTTYDAQGNVLDTFVERDQEPPSTFRDDVPRSPLRSSQAASGHDNSEDSSAPFRHQGRVVSDDYGRTGASNTGSASQRDAGASAYGIQTTGRAGEQTGSKMNPTLHYPGEGRASGAFDK